MVRQMTLEEYEKEVRLSEALRYLKRALFNLELQVDKQSAAIKDFYDILEKIRQEIEENGQTNPQDRERPEKRYKRHEKASEDG